MVSFPDVELVLLSLLDEFGYTCTFLPDDKDPVSGLPMWKTLLPVIAVNRVGGGTDGITDRPLVQVGVFADTRQQAWSVSGQCRNKILASGGTRVDGVLVDSARESQGVQQFPDLNPDNKFVASTFQLSFRRVFA
ncbi:hypothetical protein ACFULT_26325 [Rhodococcus sp. NPDC057297]|uniref:phage tail termination protein n=1 Tax=Rhodococcus sp. NPDC057297 TaxID=3346090 RepID=UPI003630C27A